MARKTGHYHIRRVPLDEWPPQVPNPDPVEGGTVPADAQTLMNMGLHEVGRTDTHVIVYSPVRDEAKYPALPGEIMTRDRGRVGAAFERLPAAVKARVLRRSVFRGRFDVVADPPTPDSIRAHMRDREERGQPSRIRALSMIPAGDVLPGDVADDDGVAVPPLAFAGARRDR